jgi:hypothetical protein
LIFAVQMKKMGARAPVTHNSTETLSIYHIELVVLATI